MQILSRARSAYCLVTLLICFCIGIPRLSATGSEELTHRFESQIPDLLTKYEVPGIAVAVIENGTPSWQQSFGYADLSKRREINSTSLFQVGRLTELVTAWGVLRLVDEGRIGLDNPVGQYIEQWKFPPSSYKADKVTIRRLLNHSGGIAPLISTGYSSEEPGPDLIAYLKGQSNLMGKVRLSYEPGTESQYSAGGYALLQLVIENVSGKSFCDFMKIRVLEPIGMHSSGFECRQVDTGRVATSYTPRGRKIPPYQHTAQAAVGLRTTLHDFTEFVTSFMPGPNDEPPGRSVISPDLVREMYRPQGPSDGQYGLGCCLNSLESGGVMIHQCCGIHGWRAQTAVAPAEKLGLVVFTNTPAGRKVIQHLFSDWCNTHNLNCLPCVEDEVSRARVTTLNILITVVLLTLLLFVGYIVWKGGRAKSA